MPRLDHESEPLTFREHADHRSYYRFSIVTVSGAGHLADVAGYDQHPDDDPAGSAGVPHRRLDPRAYGHAVLFANSARMYDLLHRLLSFVPPDDDLPEADTAAEARELLAQMEADLPHPAAPRIEAPLAAAGAGVAWVLRDLLEALPPIDPASEFHGDLSGLSRAELIEVLPGIGTAARAALDRWEDVGGTFTAPAGDGAEGAGG
jgi:hypothetical protein